MKEKLETKLNEIKQQQEQTLANLHALQGAEQMLLQLIKEVTESEDNNG